MPKSLDRHLGKRENIWFPFDEHAAMMTAMDAIKEFEDIEILRFIEDGYRVQYIEVNSETIAVDTPNDLKRVIEYFKEHNIE